MEENKETIESALRHYYRGKVYEITGEIELAIEEHIKAIELGADFADVHNSLGKLYMKVNMFREATTEFQRALSINPYYSDAKINLEEAMRLEKYHKVKQVVVEEPRSQAEIVEAPKVEVPITQNIKVKKLLFVVPVIGLVILFLTIKAITLKEPKISVYDIPLEEVSSFYVLDGKIWICNWMEQKIYCYKLKEDLELENTYDIRINPAYLTLTKNLLITIDSLSSKMNLHMLDEWLTIKNSVIIPPIYTTGISCDGKNIYLANIHDNSIYKFCMEKLKILKLHKPLKEKICGFLYDGKNYFAIDVDNNLYLLDKNNLDKVKKKYFLLLPGYRKISSIQLTKKYIYVVFESENKLYRLSRNRYISG